MNENVVIAGGGITGLMLAYELSLAGVETVVLEAASAPRRDKPAGAMNTTSVELLEQRGLMDGLADQYIPFPTAHFAMSWLDTGAVQGRFNVVVDEARVCDMLREAAAKRGAKILFGHRVTGVEQDEDGVRVQVGTDDGEHTLSGRYLVGCDGENSAVRRSAGIAFPGTDHRFYGLVGDVVVDMDELEPGQAGAARYPNGGLYMGGPIGPGTLRVVTARFDTQPPDADSPVGEAELVGQVQQITGTVLKIEETLWLSRYGFATRQAERYRAGRVFVCGDAAHTFFPLGGQRLNTCMQDAVNLGWKLAADIHGWAAPTLLGTYHAERHATGERACRLTAAQAALLAATDGAAELRELLATLTGYPEVNDYLLEFVTGLDVHYPMPDLPAHPLLGLRLGPVPLTTSAGTTTLLTLLHPGRGVLIDLSAGRLDLTAAAAWHDRVDLHTAEPTDALDATALLIRPDGHVAWAVAGEAADPAGLTAALTTWFGSPSHGNRPERVDPGQR